MKLKEFVEKFVCHNSIIRLWTPYENGHKLLCEDDESMVFMEWQLLKQGEKLWQKRYLDNEVIGVTDIFCESYREAINIVIKL